MHITDRPRFEIIYRMENYLYDARVRAKMPGGVDDRIVIVDIDRVTLLGLLVVRSVEDNHHYGRLTTA